MNTYTPFDPAKRHTLTPETAAALRQHRHNSGQPLRTVAANAGISPAYLHKLERAERAPSTTTAQALIVALGLQTEDLLAVHLINESVAGVGKDRQEPT